MTASMTQTVLEYVRKNPGSDFASVAEALSIDQQQASTCLSSLHDRGLVARQRKGRPFVYMIPEAAPARSETLFIAPEAGDTYALLTARIKELEAWKADAIAKHPDLDVDPLLLKAREIVAELYPDDNGKRMVLEGRYDNHTGVQSALRAFRLMQEAN